MPRLGHDSCLCGKKTYRRVKPDELEPSQWERIEVQVLEAGLRRRGSLN